MLYRSFPSPLLFITLTKGGFSFGKIQISHYMRASAVNDQAVDEADLQGVRVIPCCNVISPGDLSAVSSPLPQHPPPSVMQKFFFKGLLKIT